MKAGILAEFDAPEPLMLALAELRRHGFRELDAFSPYPLREAEAIIEPRRSPINWVIFPFSLASAGGAYAIQWALNAWDFPIDVGGRPAHAAPAFIPITFEMGVLGTALAGIVILFAFMGLPALYHPVFTVDGIESATKDGFWVGVDARDPAFDVARLTDILQSLGAKRVTATVPA
jgi:hypothetical protein